MKHIFSIGFLILIMTFMFTPADAGIITVCKGGGCAYDTIQAALDNAGSGDTVLVKDGTYEENIEWPGVDGIILQSENGPDNCTIDNCGNRLPDCDKEKG